MSEPPTLSELGENAVLRRLLRLLRPTEAGVVGPGDDCAVVPRNARWDTLLKTDVVVESVHFLRETEPRLIGRKALARPLSDIAAMGGLPEHALVTLLVHPSRPVSLLEDIYRGMEELARAYRVHLIGGETSALPVDGVNGTGGTGLCGVAQRREAGRCPVRQRATRGLVPLAAPPEL